MTSPPLKGVLFDKDGTLFGFHASWATWCDRVLTELAPDDDALRQDLALAAGYRLQQRDFVPGSLVVNASAEETNALWASLHPVLGFEAIEAIGLNHLGNLPLDPVADLGEVMGRLRQLGLQLGVATNDFQQSAELQLAEVGAADLFDFICGYDSGFGAKPEPGQIFGFCKRLGLQPQEVVMVGDSSHDLHAGHKAGVGINVGVLTGPASRREIEQLADVVLEDISHLPDFLAERG